MLGLQEWVDDMSLPGIKQPGAKWLYRGERYTICGHNAKNKFFKVYDDRATDMVYDVTEYKLEKLFTPLFEVGQVYAYSDDNERFEILDIFTSLCHGRDYRLFVKISEGKDEYDILYEEMVDLVDNDGLARVDIVEEAGATCTKCKKHFEYADFAVDFQCWACKNGY